MREQEWLAERFDEHRNHLRAVGYRMLGSLSDADDAVQEAWLRLSRSGASGIENLGGWLTTIVARVCLNMLRSRKSRREDPVGVRMPEPIVSRDEGADPEQQALLADLVGLALLVVLETLTPAERVAFVLHDMFAVPFDEIAPTVGRSSAAVRQLASRGRRKVRGAATTPDPDLDRQREVVNAFLAASRHGDFDALVATLDPDAVLRADAGPRRPYGVAKGATAVAERAFTYAQLSPFARRALVNGAAGVVVIQRGQPISVLAFTVARGRILAIDVLADAERLRRLDLSALDA